MKKPKAPMKDIISFRLDLEAFPELQKLIEKLPGELSDKMRSIFLFGLENASDLMDKGFSPFQPEYKSTGKRKLSFVVEDGGNNGN